MYPGPRDVSIPAAKAKQAEGKAVGKAIRRVAAVNLAPSRFGSAMLKL